MILSRIADALNRQDWTQVLLKIMIVYSIIGFATASTEQQSQDSIRAQKAERERLRYIDQDRYMADRDRDIADMERELREEQAEIEDKLDEEEQEIQREMELEEIEFLKKQEEANIKNRKKSNIKKTRN